MFFIPILFIFFSAQNTAFGINCREVAKEFAGGYLFSGFSTEEALERRLVDLNQKISNLSGDNGLYGLEQARHYRFEKIQIKEALEQLKRKSKRSRTNYHLQNSLYIDRCF